MTASDQNFNVNDIFKTWYIITTPTPSGWKMCMTIRNGPRFFLVSIGHRTAGFSAWSSWSHSRHWMSRETAVHNIESSAIQHNPAKFWLRDLTQKPWKTNHNKDVTESLRKITSIKSSIPSDAFSFMEGSDSQSFSMKPSAVWVHRSLLAGIFQIRRP